MCGSIWAIKTSESKQAKCLLFPIFYPPLKDIFLFITSKGKSTISPVLIFIFSMPGNERAKPGGSQKPKTNRSRKLFRVFCAICPLYALISCRSCEDHKVQARFCESTHATASKITLGPLSLPFFPDYSVLVKISSK